MKGTIDMRIGSIMRCGPVAIFGTLCAFAILAIQPTGASAAPVPAWRILPKTTPTNLEPGSEAVGQALGSAPKYTLVVTNVGGVAAPAEVTVTDTLPAGLSVPAGAEPQEFFALENGSQENQPCSVSGATVTCLVQVPVQPGGTISIFIPLSVSAGAAGSVTNVADVTSPEAKPLVNRFTSTVSNSPPTFGFVPGPTGVFGGAYDSSGGSPAAGAHPYSLSVGADTPATQTLPLEAPRSLEFALPSGVVVNPAATAARCTRVQFEGATRSPPMTCPAQSQVGQVALDILGGETIGGNLYNLVPEGNAPAEFGFGFNNANVRIRGGLNGVFRLTASSTELLSKYKIAGARAELWGYPADPGHDSLRSGLPDCATGCAGQPTGVAFLTMPSECSPQLPVAATATSWLGSSASEERPYRTTAEVTEVVAGCERLSFDPTVSIKPESTSTETPTGLSVDLKVPQNEGPYGLASATLKNAVFQLPVGMALTPPAANGLGACSPVQVGIGTNQPAACPSSSKLGTAELTTPLLERPLSGSIFVAEQRNNPFGTLLALYLTVEGNGVVIKLPGRVDADPTNGQLTATFANNPQLPFNELRVQFNGGNGSPRAALVTPPSCGTYTIRTELTSWASPTPVTSTTPYTVNQDCSTGGFHPKISGGTVNPIGGAFSPFVLRVTRGDGEQGLSRIAATLPEGLLAKLAGVPVCADAQASIGDCPASSQVGTTTIGAGAGSQPLYIPQPGKAPTAVYLSGPYRGAPYSLAVKVPAQAGPFDLGTVAVRVALNVDPFTAQVTASSDPLPQILEGIPIAYRDVRINVSRETFVLNPTNCEPVKIDSTITSSVGGVATPSVRFQAAGCARLQFKPKLALSVKGATKRNGHPSLKAVVTFPKGSSANISRAQVGLPHSEFLEQGNIRGVCKQADLRANTCPKAAIYGRAKAWTPLLSKPLTGPVYLGVGFGHKLPDLVADLNGQIRILVHGKVDTDRQEGLRNTFEAIPDAPVSKFILELNGGKKKGLIVNSTNICKGSHKAEVRFTGHNGKVEKFRMPVADSCKGRKRAGSS